MPRGRPVPFSAVWPAQRQFPGTSVGLSWWRSRRDCRPALKRPPVRAVATPQRVFEQPEIRVALIFAGARLYAFRSGDRRRHLGRSSCSSWPLCSVPSGPTIPLKDTSTPRHSAIIRCKRAVSNSIPPSPGYSTRAGWRELCTCSPTTGHPAAVDIDWFWAAPAGLAPSIDLFPRRKAYELVDRIVRLSVSDRLFSPSACISASTSSTFRTSRRKDRLPWVPRSRPCCC